jgi:hypothetical protein
MQSDGVTEVLAVEALRVKALVDGDIATLDRITSSDYRHVESTGKVRTKDQFLRDLEQGGYRFDSFVIDENQIRIFGDTAVVTGRYHNDIRTKLGLQPTKHALHVRIYVREGGKWINVAHQATETAHP